MQELFGEMSRHTRPQSNHIARYRKHQNAWFVFLQNTRSRTFPFESVQRNKNSESRAYIEYTNNQILYKTKEISISPIKLRSKLNHDVRYSKKHSPHYLWCSRSISSRKCSQTFQDSRNRKRDANTARPNQHARWTRSIVSPSHKLCMMVL
jgi:hypothetical protein